MRVLGASLVLWLVLAVPSRAADLYVSPDGDDQATGSRTKPFRTIQRAAALAQPGDVCHIAPGIYRETVRPAHDGTPGRPIVFKAMQRGTVTIVGMDAVRDWSRHSGSIYRAQVDWSLQQNNQLYVNGTPMPEARWPNDADGDPMTPDGAKLTGGDTDHIRSPELPADWQPDAVKGAVVWALVDRAWSSWTATISHYDPAKKTIHFPSFQGKWWVEARHNPKSGKGRFYITGALKLLDAPGEWYYDEPSQALYVWPPGDQDPDQLRLAFKARQLGLDLQSRSWITVDGIDLLGCTLDLDGAKHCLVTHMAARHISHTRGGNTMSHLGEKSGIYISGSHNTLANSEIAYSAGDGVTLGGTDNSVVNCWIHHVDYIGAYCSPIRMAGLRHLVSHNTIEHAGRDCIKLGGAEHLVQYNDIGFPGRICHDLGAIYSGGLDGGNTRIRGNFVHDNPGKSSNVGIYLDNYMKNYIVAHNVVWNVGDGIRLNRPTGYCMVYNNTVFGDINNTWGPWKGQQVQWGSHVLQNLCSETIAMNPEVVVNGNRTEQNLTAVFDRDEKVHHAAAADQPLRHPLTNRATPIDATAGAAPQLGSSWRVGHDFDQPPSVAYSPASESLRNHIRNAAFEYPRYYKGTDEDVDDLIHWGRLDGGTVAVAHHPGFNSPAAEARNAVHGNSVSLGGDSGAGITQRIDSLAPATAYFFSGYVRHAEDAQVELAVHQAGRPLATKSSVTIPLAKHQRWRLVRLAFTTGPETDGPITVSISKQGAGTAYIDDTGVVLAWDGESAP